MAGLLVGMLSNEVSYTSKEKQLTSEAQLIDLSIAQETNTYCMQPVYVTETQGYSAVVGYNKVLVKENTNNSVSACYTNGRDSPDIKDSS